jgi:hypothetical protein
VSAAPATRDAGSGTRHVPSGTEPPIAGLSRRPWPWAAQRAAAVCGFPGLIPLRWLIWHARPRSETVEATIGAIEIRRVPAGYVAETQVKGDAAHALRTGARRLARYASGENVAGAAPGTMLPVMQQQTAPGRWLVSVPVRPVNGAPPAPLSPKVRIVSRDVTWVAVVRAPARSIDAAAGLAGERIQEAIARTWLPAIGPPILRLSRDWHWPWSRREIAVPLTRGEAPFG